MMVLPPPTAESPRPERSQVPRAFASAMRLTVLLCVASSGFAEDDAPAARVSVDAAESRGPFPRIISTHAGIPRARLARMGGIWYYHQQDEVARNAAGDAVCRWDNIDPGVEQMLLDGEDLVMLFGYMPSALVQAERRTAFCMSIGLNAAPPRNYDEWESICYQAVHHFNVERRLGIRYWEVWNEPNATGFWPGTFEEYIKLYSAAAKGTKRADPNALIGGPVVTVGGPLACQRPPPGGMPIRSVASFKTPEDWKPTAVPDYTNYSTDSPYELIASFIDHCAGEGLPLDFLVWHNYNDAPGLDVYDLETFGANARLFRSWLERYPQFRATEMIVDEWGVLTPAEPLTDAVFACGAALEMAKHGVIANYPAFHPAHMINALGLFGFLGERRIQEEATPGLRVLATCSPSGRIDVMLVRLDRGAGAKAIAVSVEIKGLTLRKHLRWERYVLDAEHPQLLKAKVDALAPVERMVFPVSSELRRQIIVSPSSVNVIRVW